MPVVPDQVLPWSVLRNTPFDFVLAVRPSLGIQTFQELIAHIRANPGKLNLATTNIGSFQYLGAELLKALLAGLSVAELRDEPRLDGGAFLADLGLYPVDVEVDVHVVRHGLLVAVLHH